MSDHTIPPASLARLRAAYDQFTQLVTVVAEAMELERVDGIDLPRGVLIVQEQQPQLQGQTTLPEHPDGANGLVGAAKPWGQ